MIQSWRTQPILSQANAVLGALTGFKKTLGYLFRVIESLKFAEALRNTDDTPLRIALLKRAVVLVPTCALAAQVGAVAKSLSYQLKFRVAAVDGAGLLRSVKDALSSGSCDALICTTVRVLKLVTGNVIDVCFSTHLVTVEVYTMMGKGFGLDVSQLLCVMLKSPNDDEDEHVLPLLQSISVSAKHPRVAEALYTK